MRLTHIKAHLILFFGVKVILDFKDFSGEAEIVTLVNDFKGKVAEVYSDNKDSVVTLENLDVPDAVREICVFDQGREFDLGYVVDAEFRTKLGLGAGGSTDNLFLFGEFDKTDIKSYKVDKLFTFERNPTCNVVRLGKINMRLRNEGHNVSVFAVA